MMDKKLLLWCSPGFGLVDVWLPVIKEIRESHHAYVIFAFPEPSSIFLEDKESLLFKLADDFADSIIFKAQSGYWYSSEGLSAIQGHSRYDRFIFGLLAIARKLSYGSRSKYFYGKKIGGVIEFITRSISRFIEVSVGFKEFNPVDFKDKFDGVLCDITVGNQGVNSDLYESFKNVYKFSMLHGLGAFWVKKNFNCQDHAQAFRSDFVVFNMSDMENNGYQQCFGVLPKNLIHAGIPRHDLDWMNFIGEYNSDAECVGDYIFIIGRPASGYNTVERKIKALREISELAYEKYGLKIIVKKHPKESLDGIDGKIYREGLGQKSYGEKWIYSSDHPINIGKNARFCVCFYSGVAIDMLKLGKPTIEYLDLRGLPRYDNQDSLRDPKGTAVFGERYAGLVIGVSSKKELEESVDAIMKSAGSVLKSLQNNYLRYFEPFEGASSFVAKEIIRRISGNDDDV